MGVKLGVGIMGHPSREANIKVLSAALSKHTKVVVRIDADEEGTWPTARKCWEATPTWASHMLVLQDDVVLCRDFYVGASRALRHRPAVAVAFYANEKSIDEARAHGSSWARIKRGMWGQAQCIPSAYVRPFLAWAAKHPKPAVDSKCDDWLITEFLKKHQIPIWGTVPSLVEHGSPTESLIGFSNKNKVARWFIGADVSALSVDWRCSR